MLLGLFSFPSSRFTTIAFFSLQYIFTSTHSKCIKRYASDIWSPTNTWAEFILAAHSVSVWLLQIHRQTFTTAQLSSASIILCCMHFPVYLSIIWSLVSCFFFHNEAFTQRFDRIGTHTVVKDICRMSELCFYEGTHARINIHTHAHTGERGAHTHTARGIHNTYTNRTTTTTCIYVWCWAVAMRPTIPQHQYELGNGARTQLCCISLHTPIFNHFPRCYVFFVVVLLVLFSFSFFFLLLLAFIFLFLFVHKWTVVNQPFIAFCFCVYVIAKEFTSMH